MSVASGLVGVLLRGAQRTRGIREREERLLIPGSDVIEAEFYDAPPALFRSFMAFHFLRPRKKKKKGDK